MVYKIEMVNKVPVIDIDGTKHFVDTCYPFTSGVTQPGTQAFFGIPGLRVAGTKFLKRYVRISYAKGEIETSDEPIPFEGTLSVPMRLQFGFPMVEIAVAGTKGWRFIDTGAAYSYVHGLNVAEPAVEIAQECDHSGRPWEAPVYRVACSFAGKDFPVLCGKAADNHAGVPPEGVIGYDFFNAFEVVLDLQEKVLRLKSNEAT